MIQAMVELSLRSNHTKGFCDFWTPSHTLPFNLRTPSRVLRATSVPLAMTAALGAGDCDGRCRRMPYATTRLTDR
jgi:hypothetical protein